MMGIKYKHNKSKRGNEKMKTGTVKWYDRNKGWGFVTLDGDNGDAFVHYSNIKDDILQYITTGQRISFELTPNERGAIAKNIALINELAEV